MKIDDCYAGYGKLYRVTTAPDVYKFTSCDVVNTNLGHFTQMNGVWEKELMKMTSITLDQYLIAKDKWERKSTQYYHVLSEAKRKFLEEGNQLVQELEK